MKFRYINKVMFTAGITAVLFLSSCEKDLDRMPESEISSASVYADFSNYKQVLAKIYAGLAVSGQEGGDGNVDIGGIDGGTSNYLRQYFQMQELPTDEAVIAWNDATLPDMHNMTWSANNVFIRAMYYRIYYQVAMANEFIRETTDEKLASRNITGQNAETSRLYRNEARFMRALSYSHAIDLFGNGPFVTEKTEVGIAPPPRIDRKDLFLYIESELKDLETILKDPRTNEYGRADKAAVWMLLSKLYLNAEVYTGQQRYSDARIYAEKVINAGYSLKSNYGELFMADNNVNNNEVIFSINFDGLHTRTFGGTTYIIHAGVGGNMKPADFGINSGWGGIRSTKNLVNLFPDPNGTLDKRGKFHSDGQNLEINNQAEFADGYPLIKFKNVRKDGSQGSDTTGDFADTDFPLFRLGEAYLIYAEATLRGGGGSTATAIQYINLLRQRAYGNNSGNVTSINLDFILDERARELAWEATRRTDLIRFGKFTSSSYLWPFKGGIKDGKGVEAYRALYPIPNTDLTANPNLVQNPGY
ncbi:MULTISPECIES: RagB/SusD family nutrient uptake outer membrane protein [unclassified Chryseobacterium]|uniref:RagB/SusD family nutrient uptake outer membrane protein n=1 Tax=unclassified Chryseobacterium TaxID=2593645 RepID=UPI000F4505DB|nr:RagB/SusD family nutrient uptake outer membrane protein [Chryseobacterium sp. G0240]ROI04690.1 RagB/SusD family nutrient uptake outer membrane protein [Chryseobacterium sp. G0240]